MGRGGQGSCIQRKNTALCDSISIGGEFACAGTQGGGTCHASNCWSSKTASETQIWPLTNWHLSGIMYLAKKKTEESSPWYSYFSTCNLEAWTAGLHNPRSPFDAQALILGHCFLTQAVLRLVQHIASSSIARRTPMLEARAHWEAEEPQMRQWTQLILYTPTYARAYIFGSYDLLPCYKLEQFNPIYVCSPFLLSQPLQLGQDGRDLRCVLLSSSSYGLGIQECLRKRNCWCTLTMHHWWKRRSLFVIDFACFCRMCSLPKSYCCIQWIQ